MFCKYFNQTIKFNEQRRIFAYLDGLPPSLRCGDRHAKVDALRELQSKTQEELDALLPFVLRPTGGAVKGEL
jgi:hypothetical protein